MKITLDPVESFIYNKLRNCQHNLRELDVEEDKIVQRLINAGVCMLDGMDTIHTHARDGVELIVNGESFHGVS